MYCKNCGKDLSPHEHICLTCGFKKGTGVGYCSYCGAKVDEEQYLCIKCGHLLNEKKESVPQTMPPEAPKKPQSVYQQLASRKQKNTPLAPQTLKPNAYKKYIPQVTRFYKLSIIASVLALVLSPFLLFMPNGIPQQANLDVTKYNSISDMLDGETYHSAFTILLDSISNLTEDVTSLTSSFAPLYLFLLFMPLFAIISLFITAPTFRNPDKSTKQFCESILHAQMQNLKFNPIINRCILVSIWASISAEINIMLVAIYWFLSTKIFEDTTFSPTIFGYSFAVSLALLIPSLILNFKMNRIVKSITKDL